MLVWLTEKCSIFSKLWFSNSLTDMFYLISISLTQLRYKSLFWYTTDLICAVWVCINWHGKRNGWKCQKFSTPRSIFPLHIQMCRSFCPLQNKRNKGSFRSFIRSLHNSDCNCNTTSICVLWHHFSKAKLEDRAGIIEVVNAAYAVETGCTGVSFKNQTRYVVDSSQDGGNMLCTT